MTQVIETIRESRWRNGKRFIHLTGASALIAGGSFGVEVRCGLENAIIENLTIESNASVMTWQTFRNSNILVNTGTLIKEIARNSVAATKPSYTTRLGSTIVNPGTPILGANPIELVAQNYQNNRYYLNEELLTSDYMLEANVVYLLQFTNTSTNPINVALTMSLANT